VYCIYLVQDRGQRRKFQKVKKESAERSYLGTVEIKLDTAWLSTRRRRMVGFTI
jgi:hypothetical protein